jgi:hypothetical protein
MVLSAVNGYRSWHRVVKARADRMVVDLPTPWAFVAGQVFAGQCWSVSSGRAAEITRVIQQNFPDCSRFDCSLRCHSGKSQVPKQREPYPPAHHRDRAAGEARTDSGPVSEQEIRHQMRWRDELWSGTRFS